LQLSDVKKISDLCFNYNKLRKYSKLIGNQKQNLVMRLKGKKTLIDSAATCYYNSIRKVRTYTSHGIDHVKHNLEYGFELTGLLI